MMQLQAVLVDMDGTLVDTEPWWEESKLALAAEYGVPFSKEQIDALVGHSMMVTVRALQEAGVTLGDQEIIDHLVAHMVERARTSPLPWLPGAQDFLRRMKQAGIPMALVTQAWKPIADATAAQTNDAIQQIVSGGEVQNPKPAPDPYLLAAQKLGVDIDACVAIEDSPSGVQSAESAGCPVIVVPGIHEVPAAPRRFPVNSIAEIDLAMLDRVLNT